MKSNFENDIENQVKLLDIQILNSSYNAPLVETEVNGFSFAIGMKVQLNPENQCIEAITDIKIYSEDNEILFGTFVTKSIFFVEDYQELPTKNKKLKNLDGAFFEALSKIAVATTRGVMWHHFKGTFLHNAILPIKIS